ncbi:hypothetical protein GUJ93_ZPchr0011g27149 [Zizania palustris]|uniref:Rx N-terminal domain-containing protein n=1 Tax=Zizania palustris TaxID=103762 RepID=A0A8J6BJ12_ZIZPA|nr:hypothetical protein GUJ93_ZPchr0011g27149 [Zizania palustris]
MELLVSAVAGDLISRFISSVAQNYSSHGCKEEDLVRLERVLLRMHSVVEEAEGRHITNRGMLLQLKGLVEGFYFGYYMLDRAKSSQLAEQDDITQDEVSHEIRSFALSTPNSTKRFRFADAVRKHTSVAFGSRRSGSTRNLKGAVECLEAKIAHMREFIVLLGSYPRLPRQPYSTYLFMDKCMFGRHLEKEQVIDFLLCSDDDAPDHPYVSVLPVIGPHRIGKKTLMQHACHDERVRNRFSHIYFFKQDELGAGELSINCKVSSGKYLFVIEFVSDVDEAAWTKFRSYLQGMSATGIKVVVIGRTEHIAKFGTSQPVRMKWLSQEEYWYYFKALAFGSMDPDEHPKLVSLGMQLAAVLKGAFLGANILGEVLRANPSAKFWHNSLSIFTELVDNNLSSFDAHPEDLLDRNSPVYFTKVAHVGTKVQGGLLYDLREAGPAECELAKITSRDMILGGDIPDEHKFDVLIWKSRIPPYHGYIATFEKREPGCIVGRGGHSPLRRHKRKS